jgi:hypothetical protein
MSSSLHKVSSSIASSSMVRNSSRIRAVIQVKQKRNPL